MGQVDLDFKPSVPVFDADVALGRRHDRRVAVDSVEGTLEAMDKAGVGRAHVYAPHAAGYDSTEGNELLMATIAGQPRFVPQFAANPSADDLDDFKAAFTAAGARSIRVVPGIHNYPFRDWVVKPWMEWLAEENIPLWIPATYEFLANDGAVDPSEVYDTMVANPGVTAVLAEIHYRQIMWALPMLKSLPNLMIEVSRLVTTDGIPKFVAAAGEQRVLYGSRFPDAPMAPNLYYLHRCGLSDQGLADVCAGNLDRLLGTG